MYVLLLKGRENYAYVSFLKKKGKLSFLATDFKFWIEIVQK